MNPALAQMLGSTPEELWGRDWMQVFAESDRPRVEQGYRQMLLAGKASINAATIDARGVESPREVLLVAVHDHKMRFKGHHCIIERASRVSGRPEASRRKSVSARRILREFEPPSGSLQSLPLSICYSVVLSGALTGRYATRPASR